MSDACPICRGGILERREGRLDQSGASYLPTVVLRCPRCEYARYQPAVHARWAPAFAPPAGPAPAGDASPSRPIDAAAEALAA